MNTEEKLLLARAEDLFRLCGKYAEPRFSDFLDGGQQAFLKENLFVPYEYQFLYFGGGPECERRMLGVFPEWQTLEEGLFPIRILKISSHYGEPLSHRDYLGSILGLGIQRNKTGDILIHQNDAYVFVCKDIAEYLCSHLEKIGNRGVQVSLAEPGQLPLPERKFEQLSLVVASLRLDAVLAGILRISRSEAEKLIAAGKVQADHKPAVQGAKPLEENTLLSVRGFGRYELQQVDGMTRKGRIHLSVKRYL